MEGFQAAVLAVVSQLAERNASVRNRLALFPGLVSAEDLRYLKQAVNDFEIKTVVLPDYSQTLDGPAWENYHILPEGGTPLDAVRSLGACHASLELGQLNDVVSAGAFLEREFGVKPFQMDLPIGLLSSDRFFQTLSKISGHPIPEAYLECRGRLLDAYADGHKHAFEVRVGIYGEEDWVVSLADFTREIGMIPVLCASGGKSGRMRPRLIEKIPDADRIGMTIMEAADFDAIERAAETAHCDMLIGNSKGYRLARRLKIPLIRVGFPIHDRLGGQRQLHLGYQGTLRLFDQIVNALMGVKQDQSDVGYAYM
jgi:nitrogenase molybdenum-iron protein NifN